MELDCSGVIEKTEEEQGREPLLGQNWLGTGTLSSCLGGMGSVAHISGQGYPQVRHLKALKRSWSLQKVGNASSWEKELEKSKFAQEWALQEITHTQIVI